MPLKWLEKLQHLEIFKPCWIRPAIEWMFLRIATMKCSRIAHHWHLLQNYPLQLWMIVATPTCSKVAHRWQRLQNFQQRFWLETATNPCSWVAHPWPTPQNYQPHRWVLIATKAYSINVHCSQLSRWKHLWRGYIMHQLMVMLEKQLNMFSDNQIEHK